MKHLFPLLCVILFGSLSVSAQTTYGCNDSDACNYDEAAILSNGGDFDVEVGCTYTGNFCAASPVLKKLNEDCECVPYVLGCMESEACNFDVDATFPGPCNFEHTTDNNCWKCSDEIPADGVPSAQSAWGSGQSILVSNDMNNNGICDEEDIIGCNLSTSAGGFTHFNFDGDATSLNLFGAESPCKFKDPNDATQTFSFPGLLDSAGVPFRLQDPSSVARDINDFDGDGNTNEFGSPNTNPWRIADIDKVALEFNANGLPTNGLGIHPLYVLIQGDSDENGTSDFAEIEGCMNKASCNYNPDATRQPSDHWDSTNLEFVSECVAPGLCGCLINGSIVQLPSDLDDDYYTNQDTDVNGTAVGIPSGDCNCEGHTEDAVGACLAESDPSRCENDSNPANNICDTDDVEGCMNEDACNYSLDNTWQNGTDEERCNFPSDDCGCLGILTWEKPVLADYNGASLPSDYTISADSICDCRGAVSDAIGDCRIVHPLIQNGNTPQDPKFCFADTNNNGVCDAAELAGCTDPTACNYFEGATLHIEGSCYEFNECNECVADASSTDYPNGACNCLGDVSDECGVCGGSGPVRWYLDSDGDGYGDAANASVDESCEMPNDGSTYVRNAGDCDDSNPTIGLPSLCGQCGDPDPYFLQDVWCGCEPWPSFESDGFCDCVEEASSAYGVEKIAPMPGRNCDEECIYGNDPSGNGLCIIPSVKEVTLQPEVYTRQTSGSNMITNQDVFAMERWMANIDSLHSRMSKNLDDGSYDGYSDTLTIEKAIINNGTLTSMGEAEIGGGYLIIPDPRTAPIHGEQETTYHKFNPATGKYDKPTEKQRYEKDGVTPRLDESGNPMYKRLETVASTYTDSIIINTNLYLAGRFRVKGSTFSDGGINTSSLNVSGDLDVGGNLLVEKQTELWEQVTIQDDLRIKHDLGQVAKFTMGGPFAGQGDAADKIGIEFDSEGAMTGGYLNLTSSHAQGYSLNTVGDATIGGSLVAGAGLKVNMTVDAATPELEVNAVSTTVNNKLFANKGLEVSKATKLLGSLDVNGQSTFRNDADFRGELSVAKKFSANRGAAFGGEVSFGGKVKMNSSLHVGPTTTNENYVETNPDGTTKTHWGKHTLYVSNNSAITNGILINLDPVADKTNDANYVTFVDGNVVAGRIEGESVEELQNNGGYMADYRGAILATSVASAELARATYKIKKEISDAAHAVARGIASLLPSLGFPSSDVGEGASNAVEAVNEGADVIEAQIDFAFAVANSTSDAIGFGLWRADVLANAAPGVTYASGAGDYAEWIEKQDKRLDFLPGEVVGVTGGLISYDTYNSDHNMVVSTKPMLLGNEIQGDMTDYEKIAFMGQVPIRIQGQVNQGDYILPSNENNGYARAVSRDEIGFDDIPDIVGVAWESGSSDIFNVVNCSVGLDRQGSSRLVDIVQAELLDIRQSISNEISLAVVENGFVNERRMQRMKNRKRKRGSKLPIAIQKPISQSSQKDIATQSVSDAPVMKNAEDQLLLQNSLELQAIADVRIKELSYEIDRLKKNNVVVGSKEIAGLTAAAFNSWEELRPGVIDDIKNDRPIALNPQYAGLSTIMNQMVEEIEVVFFEHHFSNEKLEEEFYEAFQKFSRGGNNELLKAYPRGSKAMQDLIDKMRAQVFEAAGI